MSTNVKQDVQEVKRFIEKTITDAERFHKTFAPLDKKLSEKIKKISETTKEAGDHIKERTEK